VRVRTATVLLAAGLGGCALRSDVTRLQLQVQAQQLDAARRDSVTQANLAAIARMLQGTLDSLAAQQAAITGMRGDVRVDLYNIEQQLVAVQELTGQSQQRLTELRAQMAQREQQAAQAPPAPAPAVAESGSAAAPGAAPAAESAPDPDQLMELGLQQLRRGSPATARSAFAEFLKLYPTNARAGDAVFFTGEAWTADQQTDSAAAAYRTVVQQYPASGHVAAALFRLGVIAGNAGHPDQARRYFNQLIGAYPLSDEAALAREQLRSLGGGAGPKPSHP